MVEFVDQRDLGWRAIRASISISFLNRLVTALKAPARNGFQIVEKRQGLQPAAGFNSDDDNIDASLQLRLRIFQHDVSLADTGSRADNILTARFDFPPAG
jgi:hypothetical protein